MGERGYYYITTDSQEDVLFFYTKQLPLNNWAIDWIFPNDNGGYIIYRKEVLDFIYIYEEDDFTHVLIFLSSGSPSLNP